MNIFEILFFSLIIIVIPVALLGGFYADMQKEESYREWCENNGGFYVRRNSAFSEDKCDFPPELRVE